MTTNNKELNQMYKALYDLNQRNIAQFQKQLKQEQRVLAEQIGRRLIDEIVHRTSVIMAEKKDNDLYSYYRNQFENLFNQNPPANAKVNT